MDLGDSGMGNIVEIRNLNMTFESNGNTVQALKDINLDIEEGTFISIIGGSGCGKSTLLRIIGGLETNYEGKVLFEGKKVTNPSRDKGFIFQDHRLLPWLSVRKNIEFSLPENKKKDNELIMKCLDIVGLSDFVDSYPRELSGGMAQRVAIARALANKPKILLLDEPFGSLDAITKIHLQEQMLKIWKKEKITMIIVTHDIDEAVYLGSKVVIMTPRPGKIKRIQNIELGAVRLRTGSLFTQARDLVYSDFFENAEVPQIEYNI